MSIKLLVQQGKEGNPVADLTSSMPTIQGTSTPMVRAGMHYGMGDSNQSTFTLMERTGSELAIGHREAGRRLTTLIEDVTGCDHWVHRGRENNAAVGRGARPGGNNTEHDETSFDGNMELRGQPFPEAWVRPAETGYERLVALQAYMLNGPDSTSTKHRDSCRVVVLDSHLCKDANSQTMPATTYPVFTQPFDVVQDCASTEGKEFGVVIHEGAFPSLSLVETLTWDGDDSTYMVHAANATDGVDHTGTAGWYGDSGPETGGTPGVGTESTTYFNHTSIDNGYPGSAFKLIAAPGDQVRVTGWIFPYWNEFSGTYGQLAVQWYSFDGINFNPIAYEGIGAVIIGDSGHDGPWQSFDGTTGVAPAGTVGYSLVVLPCGSGGTSYTTGVHGVGRTYWRDQWRIYSSGGGGGDCDHLCLQYIKPEDYATPFADWVNPSIARISDLMDDYAPRDPTTPTFFPIPDQGKYTQGDAGALISAFGLTYQTPTGSGAVFVEDPTTTDAYDYWGESGNDSMSLTTAQATLRANAYLAANKITHVSHVLSILVNPDQVHLVRAGMAIQVKGRAIMGEEFLGTWQTRRIVDVIAQPEVDLTPVDGQPSGYHYRLQLQLDRPQRIVPQSPSIGAPAGDAARATVVSPPAGGSTTTIQQFVDDISGLLDGGSTGEVLTKLSGTDFDFDWEAAGASAGSMVPYYIAPGDTFEVPLYKQGLFKDTIEVDGFLVVNGRLLGVD